MSFAALAWALTQKTERSSEKFTLIMLANYANADNESYPSIQRLCDDLCMDRKTVIRCLAALKEQNLIIDSGERNGKSGQIVVYRLNLSGSERVPFFPPKESQKRYTEPNIGTYKPDTSYQGDPIAQFMAEESPPDDRKKFWDEATGILMALGLAPAAARSFAGRCLKMVAGDVPRVLAALEEALAANPREPIPFIVSILGLKRKDSKDGSGRKAAASAAFDELQEQINRERQASGDDGSGGGAEDHGVLHAEPHQQPLDLFEDGRGGVEQVSRRGARPARRPARGHLGEM